MSKERENLKRLKHTFDTVFRERMLSYGFNHSGGGMCYEKTDFGRKGVVVLSNFRFGALQISANMAVAIARVEKLLLEYRTNIRGDEADRRLYNQTVSKNLGDIKIGIYRWWNNYDEVDVEETVSAIDELIRNHGLAFLSTVDTPRKVLDEILQTTERTTKLGHPTFWWQTGYALMYMLGRRDLYERYEPIFERLTIGTSTVRSDYLLFREWIESLDGWNAK